MQKKTSPKHLLLSALRLRVQVQMSLDRLVAVRLSGPLQCHEECCDWENIAFWEEKEKEGTK